MKPYTTIESLSNGVRYLPAQLNGIRRSELGGTFQGRRLLACSVPQVHDEGKAWQVILDFDCDLSIELTSSSTVAQGWEEFGTINVEVLDTPADQLGCSLYSLDIPNGLNVARVDIVRWRGAGLVVDSGISFHFTDGRKLSVVASDSPGALLLALPGAPAPVSWQFPSDEYRLEPMDGVYAEPNGLE